jgi:hypothetical protein
MGDLTEGLELRCSRCRAIADVCSVCGDALGVGEVRCAPEGHHHEHCEDERRRRLIHSIHARKITPLPMPVVRPIR